MAGNNKPENLPTSTNKPNEAHYLKLDIQPIDFIVANNLGYLEGNIIKYVSRYKFKGGLSDLEKARNYLDWLMKKVENENL